LRENALGLIQIRLMWRYLCGTVRILSSQALPNFHVGPRLHALLIRVPATPSAFRPRAQQNAFRRRDVRQ
jgi:hypothetical protein